MSGIMGRALALFFLLSLLLIGVLAAFLPADEEASGRRAFSADADGRHPAYLLLVSLGFRPERWTDAPGRLPAGAHLLLLPAAPPPPLGLADAPAGDPAATGSRRRRDPLHYRRFLEEGGALLSGLDEGRREFLADELFLAGVADLAVESSPAPDEAPARAVLATGEEIPLAPDLAERFAPATISSDFEVLAADEEGRPLAVERPVGRGRLVLLASDALLGRDEIGRAGHALLLVRLVEELAPGGRILFDDYALGDWRPDSPLALALAPGARAFTLHLLLLGLLAVWGAARPFPFPRDPEPLALVSPLTRVRAWAATLVRLRRWNLLGTLLVEGARRRPAGLAAARLDRAVASEEDLERLGRELARLEARSALPAPPRPEIAWKKRLLR
ncbi:MAG: hypothetical protein AB1726_18040 [Planctomycetota bacterium]